jgi:hypothetical protein
MTPEHRALVEARAAAGHSASRFLLAVLRRREVGTHRQATVAEIFARVAERQAAGFITHASGRVHSALNPCEACQA